MNRTYVLDVDGVCSTCFAQRCGYCTAGHQPCMSAALGQNDSQVTGIISPRDRRMPEWLSDVEGSLALDYAPNREVSVALPTYLPVLERQASGTPLPDSPAYAIHLHSVLTAKRLDVRQWVADLRGYFCLPPDTKVVLLCYARDSLMDEMWALRTEKQVVSQIMNAGFDLVAAPNFSVYADQPRITHLFRMRQSHLFYRDMIEAGLPVIPHIYFGEDRDVERWAEWLASNPSIRMVACNLQTATSPQFFGDMLDGLHRIGDAAATGLRFVVSGPTTPARIRQVFECLGQNVTITNAKPHQVAAKRHLLLPDGRQAFAEGSYTMLFEGSLRVMESRVGNCIPPVSVPTAKAA